MRTNTAKKATTRKTKQPAKCARRYPADITARLKAASSTTGCPVSSLEIMLIRHGLDELEKGRVTITENQLQP